jgi:hypothetical protein
MSHEAQTIAGEIRKAHLQFEAGRIEIWGVATVRPNDLSYRILDATVHGDRLDIHLASPYDTVPPISIFEPRGLKVVPEGLEIASASRITWDPDDAGAWDAVLRGSTADIKAPVSGVHQQPVAGLPALFLGRS